METKDTVSLCSKIKDVQASKYKMLKEKERCMAYFRSLHSHLQVLSKEDLKGTRIEHGFKRAFMSLFGQDDDTFTTFWVINRQFQKFIDSQFTLDYDSQMSDKYFAEYTGIEYDRRVNKRQMQTQESKIDIGKALDADLVVMESSGTESGKQDTSSKSRNDTNTDNADIKPVYDEEPMAENLVWPKLCKENETLKKHYKDLYDSIKITRSKTIEQTTSLLANNADLKAQIHEKVFAIAALKNVLRKLKGNSGDFKFD
ncbi:hypothetical protein Tco_0741519 [Tanacetum coccineum]